MKVVAVSSRLMVSILASAAVKSNIIGLAEIDVKNSDAKWVGKLDWRFIARHRYDFAICFDIKL